MYIQITTRCNMRCDHCCYSCTSRGEDMSLDTFMKALCLAETSGSTIAIGGGEPTIHPLFWRVLGAAFESDIEFIWLATNGKLQKTACALAGLAEGNQRFSCALSRDYYHEPIDPRVPNSFRCAGLEIRDVSYKVIRTGRAKRNGIGSAGGCVCPEITVTPAGDIRPCGCNRVPIIGNVHTGGVFEKYKAIMESDEYNTHQCWKKYKKPM